jgi:hypothetical protein
MKNTHKVLMKELKEIDLLKMLDLQKDNIQMGLRRIKYKVEGFFISPCGSLIKVIILWFSCDSR